MAVKKSKSAEIEGKESEEPRVKNLFVSIAITLIMTGQAVVEFQNYLPKYFYYVGIFFKYLMIFCAVFLPFHLAVLHVKTVYDAFLEGNLQMLSSAGFMVVIYIACIFYEAILINKHPNVQKFFRFYNENYAHKSFEGLTCVSTYRTQNFGWKIMTYWQLACVGATLLWCTIPLVTAKNQLPLNCWYPFDPLQPKYYKIIYFIQVLGQYQVGLAYSNMSGLYMYSIVNTCGQYDVLFCNLKNLIYNAEIKSGKSINELRAIQKNIDLSLEELNQYMFCEERKTNLSAYMNKYPAADFNSALNETFKQCVLFHRFILSLCEQLEDMCNAFLLIKVNQSTLQLCFIAFTFVYVESNFFEYVNLFQYLLLSTIEILLFTYFGEMLSQQSLRVGDALYRSPWYLHLLAVRSNWTCMMPRTFRPVRLTAGKFLDINVSRFRNVVTTSFSFLTLLQSLNDKKSIQGAE